VALGKELPSIDQLVADRIGSGSPLRSLHASTLVGVRESGAASPYPAYYHFAGGGSAIESIEDPGLFLDMVRDAAGSASGAGCRCERSYVGLTGPGAANPLNGPALVRAQAETIGLAFQCGLTRVATLQLGHPDCGYQVPYPGASAPFNLAVHNMGDANDRVTSWVSARYMMDRIADVLDVLQSIGVLESTLVVAASEMGSPEFDSNHCILIVGGEGGAFRLKRGEHIALLDSYRVTKLLVTILQYFDIDSDAVGNYAGDGDYRGPLLEIIV
jgi:hypothetical protein